MTNGDNGDKPMSGLLSKILEHEVSCVADRPAPPPVRAVDRPLRSEVAAPCTICGSPLFWVSVYRRDVLNCWGCDYPPAWAMVAERWSIVAAPGSAPGGELKWEQHPPDRWAAAGWERIRASERVGRGDDRTDASDPGNQPLDGDALVAGEGAGRGGRQGDGFTVEFEYHDSPASVPRDAMLRLHRRVVVTDAELVDGAIRRIEAFEKLTAERRMATVGNMPQK